MMRFWLLALRNLGRNRRRNLATGSAIAFGFAGILLLSAYTYRATNYIRVYTVYVVHTGHLAIFPEGGFENFAFQPEKFSLSSEDQAIVENVIQQTPEIELWEKQIRGQGLIGNGCTSFPFVGQGYDPQVDNALKKHPQIKEWMPNFHYFLRGQGLWNYDEKLGAILLSRGLSLALGKTRMHEEIPTGNSITLPDCTRAREQAGRDANVQLLAGAWAGNMSAVDGEVTGVFTTGVQESDNSGVVTSVSLLQKLFETDRVTQYALWLKNPDQLKTTKAKLEAGFKEHGRKFELIEWDEERLSPYYVGTVKFLETMVLAGALVLATIITLSVLNSATLTILERSQEIGMYRSMGFRRSHLKLLYVQESLCLTAVALLAGTVIGLAAIRAINAAEIMYNPPGIAGGLTLTLVLPLSQALSAASLLLVLVSSVTLLAVSHRLRQSPADLLGGTLR